MRQHAYINSTLRSVTGEDPQSASSCITLASVEVRKRMDSVQRFAMHSLCVEDSNGSSNG